MKSIENVLRRVTTVTFDCYGTLIDWAGGLQGSFRALFGDALAGRTDEMFDVYVRIEAQIEAQDYRSYRSVLAEVATQLAQHFDVDMPAERSAELANRLPNWPPFPDTNEALKRLKQKYRLGILSNVDRDLLAGTLQHFEVDFDFVVTAQDVESYKPAHGHFDRLLAQYAVKGELLHVAQSLFHDGNPTRELGIAYVWINRYNDVNETIVCPCATFADLASLATAAGV
jgi:2-haloalkanoic acid dehalogenase type II